MRLIEIESIENKNENKYFKIIVNVKGKTRLQCKVVSYIDNDPYTLYNALIVSEFKFVNNDTTLKNTLKKIVDLKKEWRTFTIKQSINGKDFKEI